MYGNGVLWTRRHSGNDGVGGADVTAGSGLRGLSDRLDALGGTLTVEGLRGGGTIVKARVPSQLPGSAAPDDRRGRS